MEIKDVGIIYDIESHNFIADGSLYVESVSEENQKINILSKTLSSFAFENVIAKIIEEASTTDKIKDEEYYSNEILTFFDKNKGKRVDLIFFTENGIKGINKVSLNDTSILYFSLYGNIKLGFFINKTLAKVLFGGDVVGAN